MHGSDELKNTYLPKMVSGEWTGTMCLTEPHAGTDLALLRTKAEPQADGSYAISGTKIFISGGEQDMTDNIVHLVLARLPDAPPWGERHFALPCAKSARRRQPQPSGMRLDRAQDGHQSRSNLCDEF